MANQSLPDLVAKLKIDGTAARAEVATLVTEVKRIGSNTNLGNVTKGLEQGASKAATGIENLGKRVDGLARSAINATKEVAGNGGLFGAAGGLAGGVPILGGLVLGITGLFGALDLLQTKTAANGASILRNSELIGISTRQYQSLTNAAALFGVGQEQINLTLIRFQKSLEQGAPTLKSMGLSLRDVGITSNDTGTAINQLSSFLQHNTDTMQRNAVGQALLGRGSASLIEVLSKGPDTLNGYTQYLMRMGVILDDNELKTAAMANTVNNQFKVALQGLETQVGVQLEGAFSRLYLTILQALGPTPKAAFDNIGKAIANVLSWVVGLIDGLFGLNITLASMAGVVDKNAMAFNDLATTQQDAGAAVDGVTPSLTANQAAMTALEDATTRQTDALQSQIKVIDDQQSTLEYQIRMTDLLMDKQNEQGTSYLAHLEQQLAFQQSVDDSKRRSGETLLDYQRRLTAQDLKSKIDSAKKQQDTRKTDEQIQLEQARRITQVKKDALQKQIADLQTFLNNARRAEQAKEASDEKLMSQNTGALRSNLNTQSGDFGNFFKNVNSGASNAGVKFGQAIDGMIGKIGGLISRLGDLANSIDYLFGGGAEDDATNGVLNTVLSALVPGAPKIQFVGAGSMKAGSLASGFANVKKHADGGWISEPVVGVGMNSGRGYSFAETGPEHVANTKQMSEGAHGGGGGLQVIFNGPVADQYVADRVINRINRGRESTASRKRMVIR